MSLNSSTFSQVTVLLSTYNGGKFLGQQLDSLYRQTYSNLRILVRDDGSTDSTLNMLRKEQAEGRLRVLDGHNNLGPALSFMELLRQVALTDTNFAAFCDQDDVWHTDKISHAVNALSQLDDTIPAMYAGRIEIVDENLDHIGFGSIPAKLGFGNALVENVITGCTIVLNRKAIDLLCEKPPTNPLIHDWWCYMALSCFGKIIFDPAANIKYRQHAANTIGIATSRLTHFTRRLKRFFGKKKPGAWCTDNAVNFLDSFADRMPLDNKLIIQQFIASKTSPRRRMQLAFSGDIWRQSPLDNIILRILILINRI